MFCEFCKLRKSTSIIRTKDVCKECCSILKKDNLNRQAKGIPIEDNLKILPKTFKLIKEHPYADVFREYIDDKT
jgi:hypothetical protein